MIGQLAAILILKFGVRLPRVLGMLPARYYISEAVRCLRRDDLDGAMMCYRTARAKAPHVEEAKVLHEVLTLEMRHRRQALTKRREVLQRTLSAAKQNEDRLGAHLTNEFCAEELAATERALTIIEAFAGELAGEVPPELKEGRAIN